MITEEKLSTLHNLIHELVAERDNLLQDNKRLQEFHDAHQECPLETPDDEIAHIASIILKKARAMECERIRRLKAKLGS